MEDGRGAETRAIVGAAIVKLELIRLEAHERVEDLLYVLAPLVLEDPDFLGADECAAVIAESSTS